MEFTVEDLSPVKKKVTLTVAPEEIDASLAAAVTMVKNNVQMDGFRKGKVPASVIEKRFQKQIQEEAHESLINVHINDVLQKLDLTPASAITMSGEQKPFVKGQPFVYSMEFEIRPKFDLPVYDGLEVEETKVLPSESVVNAILERFARENAKLVPVAGTAPVQDGQVANVDFEVLEDGQPQKDFSATNFDLEVGSKLALKEFEDLVKTIPVGHTGEGDVTFPNDFLAKDLAGKTIRMKVTVHAVKERAVPELTDEYAQSLSYKDLADMRAAFAKSYAAAMGSLYKAKAQHELLDKLCKQVDFELPPSFVKAETTFLVSDFLDRMEKEGKNAAPDRAAFEKLMEEYRPRGEEHAREKIILLAIAKKENLEVTSEEVLREVYNGSRKIGTDFKEYYQKMQDTGLILTLKENMLCDKAMDLVYERAKIAYVEPQNDEKTAGIADAAADEAVEAQERKD